MRPDEEDAIWSEGVRKEARLSAGSPPNNVLANRFPELKNASGAVDPAEVLMVLVNKVEELERRVENAGD